MTSADLGRLSAALLTIGVVGACASTNEPAETNEPSESEAVSACTYDSDDVHRANFSVVMEGAADPAKDSFGRMDKVGNACRIASAAIVADKDLCSTSHMTCDSHDSAVVRIQDPWHSDEFTDIACPTFVALACGRCSDLEELTESCRQSLIGERREDPLFMTPASFLCGLAFAGAITGAQISTGKWHPEHSTQTALLGAGVGVLASIACAAIPF